MMEDLNLKEKTTAELNTLLEKIKADLESRAPAESVIVELDYNHYKGSGKCWWELPLIKKRRKSYDN